MAVKNKKPTLHSILCFIIWVSGVLVSLAVGFSMTAGGALNDSIPYIPSPVTAAAGWVVIVLTVISVILGVIESLFN